jgi:hypothetical protein
MNYYRNGDILKIGFVEKEHNNKINSNGLMFKLKINDN